ncbi:MAG TPA: hypothetical protein VGQ21_13340 [Thermoanaerobaculia bacterium]|nr:hypothetical protein [Thermoanaerobaculia bacterium]
MSEREVLKDWVIDALNEQGGGARVVDVCKQIWKSRAGDLRAAGDLFYTWQYEVRWAAQMLRDEGRLERASPKRRGWWEVRRAT